MLQEVLANLKGEYHAAIGTAEGLNNDQSDVVFDATMQGVTEQLKGLIFSGKLNDLQKLVSEGADAVRESDHFKDMIHAASSGYYGLERDQEGKNQLAEKTVVFIFNGLRDAFEKSGKTKDFKGIMEFAGLDSGLLGKLGGLMGGLGNMFKKK